MKIAIIGSRGIPARYGGFETFAQELAPRLVEMGHEVTVYCRAGYTGARDRRDFKGVRLIHTPYLKVRSLETLSHEAVSIADSLWRGFDLWYFLGTRSSPLYLPLIAAKRRVLIHTDGIEWQRRKWGSAGRAYLRFAEWLAAKAAPGRLVTDAEAMRAYYLDRYGRDSSVIPYGAEIVEDGDPAPLARWGLEPGSYYLVVCRLEPENNVDVIVREFMESGSTRDLVVVGGASYDTSYQRRLLALSSEHVKFIGPVYGDDLVSLRFHAYTYIHGHEVGGTNPSLLEAMGCGNACLALDTPFNREVLGALGSYWLKGEGILASLIRESEERGRGVTPERMRSRILASYSWAGAVSSHEILARSIAR